MGFCRIMGFSSVSSGFWGRETKTDPSELVFGGENPLLTTGVGRVSRFGSVPVGSPGGLGHRICLDSPIYA